MKVRRVIQLAAFRQLLSVFCLVGVPAQILAAGSSPLAEWQSSAGVLLDESLEGPPVGWNVNLGATAARLSAYEGALSYRELYTPLIDIRYRNLFFASTEEGIGANLFRTKSARSGVAFTCDFGRSAARTANELDVINSAPEIKLFAEKLISPGVLRIDVRRALGGYSGWVADLGGYVALPLNDELNVLMGPSLTAADSRYMKSYFGVSSAVSANSGFRVFDPRSGIESAAFGLNLVWSPNMHWTLEGFAAYDCLLDIAAASPLSTTKSHVGGGASIAYEF